MDNQNMPASGNTGAKAGFPGIIDLIKKSIDVFKENPWIYIGLSIIFVAASFVIAFVFGIIFGATIFTTIGAAGAKKSLGALLAGGFFGILFTVIFSILLIVVASWFSASFLCAIKEKQRKIEIKEALSMGWKYTRSLFWVTIINAVVVGVGFLLLVVPGIIFSVWFSFSMYVLIWEDIKGVEALKRSKALVNGYWWSILWKFLGAGLIMAAINLILNFIPFIGPLIVSLVIAPIFMIYVALVYEELKRIKGGSASAGI
jgi:site-specific recombinase